MIDNDGTNLQHGDITIVYNDSFWKKLFRLFDCDTEAIEQSNILLSFGKDKSNIDLLTICKDTSVEFHKSREYNLPMWIEKNKVTYLLMSPVKAKESYKLYINDLLDIKHKMYHKSVFNCIYYKYENNTEKIVFIMSKFKYETDISYYKFAYDPNEFTKIQVSTIVDFIFKKIYHY